MRTPFANTDIRVQGHAAYGTKIPHYAVVEACLLYTVETLSGSAFNLDVKLAWTEIYNFIAGTMIEASA